MSAESEVLHAIIEGNEDHATELLRDFLPGEVRALYHQSHRMAALCEEQAKAKS